MDWIRVSAHSDRMVSLITPAEHDLHSAFYLCGGDCPSRPSFQCPSVSLFLCLHERETRFNVLLNDVAFLFYSSLKPHFCREHLEKRKQGGPICSKTGSQVLLYKNQVTNCILKLVLSLLKFDPRGLPASLCKQCFESPSFLL